MTLFLENLLDLSLEAAPWLALGLVAAGMLKGLMPVGALSRLVGRPGVWSVVRGAFIGVPLPLCSCGVIPAALGLRREGASKGATVSFLVATPQTGVDSLAVSYAMLGPMLTIARPIASVITAIAGGLAAEFIDPPPQKARANKGAREEGPGSCCGEMPVEVKECCGGNGGTSVSLAVMNGPVAELVPAAEEATCCSSGGGDGLGGAWWKRAWAGQVYAWTRLLDDMALWLVIGLVIAAVVVTTFPPSALASIGSGLPAMVAMVLLGIPMYICATASTPVAASLLVAGVSPGTVLVFLLAGPATNAGTVALIRRELGTASTAAYLGAIIVVSIVSGLVTDWVLGAAGWTAPEAVHVHGGSVGLVIGWVTLVMLVGLGCRKLVPAFGASGSTSHPAKA